MWASSGSATIPDHPIWNAFSELQLTTRRLLPGGVRGNKLKHTLAGDGEPGLVRFLSSLDEILGRIRDCADAIASEVYDLGDQRQLRSAVTIARWWSRRRNASRHSGDRELDQGVPPVD
jgi:hypothetical protein